MFTSIKFRLYPTKEQAVLFQKTAGCCRLIYNKALHHKIKIYQKTGKSVSQYELMEKLTRVKKKDEYSYLNEIDSTALQNSLKDLNQAYQRFFKHGNGFPRFKSKRKSKASFRCSMSNVIDTDSRTLDIGKYKQIKARGSFRLYDYEKIVSTTVSLDSNDNWYASVLIKKDTTIKDHVHQYESCGIDLGVKKPVVIAYENHDSSISIKRSGIDFSKRLRELERRRKRYQRSYARKKKGSSNQGKVSKLLAKAFHREKCIRRDWIEKTTHDIASHCRIVVVENLNVKGMTKSSKGTMENPGKNVAQKSGLNREMRRLGLGTFLVRLESKVSKYQGTFIKVDPRHTSQRCFKCGYTSKTNRLSQSQFECQRCGHTDNADYNAARNIRDKGSLAA